MSLNLNYSPEVYVEDTTIITEEQWLQYRKNGVGGSEAGTVMGVSPFCTKRDLFYDKLGIKPVIDEEDNWLAKKMGHALEALIAELFSRKMGLEVFPVRKMFRHSLYPFMLADVDFFIRFPDGTLGILECKTTNPNAIDKWDNDAVPINYEYQGRHYMSVMNLNVVYYACLYSNNEDDFIIRELKRDLDIEADMIAEEEYFWTQYVMNKIAPPYTEKPDLVLESIRKHYGPADKDTGNVQLSKICLPNIKNYIELKQEKARIDAESKRLETRMKEAYSKIVDEMGVSCSGILKDGATEYQISYNPVCRTLIDKAGLERLKLLHPEIYGDYVTTTESRRFNVKVKGAA